MADYLKSTNFATKDALPSGNPGKIVKGTEIDTEFNAIADAVESKADLLNPTFSGLLTTDTLATTSSANIGGTLSAPAINASDDITMSGTGKLTVARGTTAQRPTSPTAGAVRFNTDLGYLENYTGTEWRAVGYVTPADVSDKANTAKGYFQVPVGTAAQRPSVPLEGLIRYNSDSDIYEGYINSAWHKFVTVNQGVYTITYLAVAGGGGGGGTQGGGGGGGGGSYAASTTSVTPGSTVITMTIGAGGAAGANGSAGTATSISGIATTTGGNGGSQSPDQNYGGAGGSSGNGYAGGSGAALGGGGGAAGGGGGSAGAGANGTSGGPGSGGIGYETLITGVASRVGGGGGGAGGSGSSGGAGGGGNGAGVYVGGSAGGLNTGGGGGGGTNMASSAGGSGVVYLSMPTANYTGTHTGSPTIITSGSNTILKFTSSGTYTC